MANRESAGGGENDGGTVTNGGGAWAPAAVVIGVDPAHIGDNEGAFRTE
jgi:hypothetical protein